MLPVQILWIDVSCMHMLVSVSCKKLLFYYVLQYQSGRYRITATSSGESTDMFMNFNSLYHDSSCCMNNDSSSRQSPYVGQVYLKWILNQVHYYVCCNYANRESIVINLWFFRNKIQLLHSRVDLWYPKWAQQWSLASTTCKIQRIWYKQHRWFNFNNIEHTV